MFVQFLRMWLRLIKVVHYLLLFSLLALVGCNSSSSDGVSSGFGAVESPVRIDLTADGAVVVSDYVAGKVFFLDPATLAVTQSFNAPIQQSGVAVADDVIFLGMETLGAVGAYDFDGNLLYKLGSGNGEFQKPNDMFIDHAAQLIYVVDTSAKAIKVYQLDGTPVNTAFGAGTLNFPTGIALDESSDTILVSDFALVLGGSFGTNEPGIWRFDLSGNLVESIQGSFSRPQGLAAEKDKIFLVDSLLGQVIVLQKDSASTDYLELARFGGSGVGETLMKLPLDAVIDPFSKDLFVTSNTLGKVELFPGGGDI